MAGPEGLLSCGEAWADWNDREAGVPVTPSPDVIHVVVAGANSYFAAVLPGWGFEHAARTQTTLQNLTALALVFVADEVPGDTDKY